MIKISLSFKGRIQKIFRPTGGEVRIGRGPDCDIQIDNLGVKPLHARIAIDGKQATLLDASDDGSVLVNGKQISKHVLQQGDEVLIGKHTLTFARDDSAVSRDPEPPSLHALTNGWLQFLSGPKMGRTLRLDRNMVRLGKSGGQSALIASRADGYYISHLAGDKPTKVGNTDIGEESVKLNDGDTIQIGDTQMLFFLDDG